MDFTAPKNILLHYLEQNKTRIISRDKLEVLFQDKAYPKRIIYQLRKQGWVTYILNGYYYICDTEEHRFDFTNYTALEMTSVVLNKLKIDWYLGLTTALERNNVVWQGHNTIVILNNKLSRTRTVQGTKIEFRKLKKKLFGFGINKIKTKNQLTMFYSNTEKTFMDFVYYKEQPPQELIQKIPNNNPYLTKYPLAVQKRAQQLL
ncbi:MAG: type IV toxin-antitoxin system AbiEi family antitoxin domain-containing protein [Candidatus Woesearchaeota archaeon]